MPNKNESAAYPKLICLLLSMFLAAPPSVLAAQLQSSDPQREQPETMQQSDQDPGAQQQQQLQQQNLPPAPDNENAPEKAPNVVVDESDVIPSEQRAVRPARKPETEKVEKKKNLKESSNKPLTPPELTEFQKMVKLSIGQTLPIYGQKLFERVPSTFAPVDHVPVTADYVLGPGDELLIRAWGQIDLDIRATVDRNGQIYIPKVGNLNVAGVRYDQVQSFLTSNIGRIYKNFDLNVTMGELRSIDVFVVGQARRPGRYTLSSLSTLTNAVFASGGPSGAGSMRHIQLKRGSNIVGDFDLYELLLRGDKSKDVLLQPEDVIYFAPVGPQVAMAGQVNVPAIYELKGESTVGDALQLAAGLATTADGSKVYIEQIKDREARSIEGIKLDQAGLAHPLHDGDVLNFAAISPRFVNSVTLRGNVAQPGRYPWREGMRVNDLIPDREFLITRQYWNQQNAIDLQTQIAGKKASVNDVRRNAPEINWDYAVIQRISEQDLSTELLPFNLGKAVLQHEEASNLLLRPGDVVTIFSQADLRVPREQKTKLVRLEGEFVAAGIYRAAPGDTLRDLVNKSGGLAPSAYLYASVFTRESTRVAQQQRLDLLISQMERDLARQEAQAAQNARTADEAAAARTAADAQRASLDKLRQLKADGRIILNLHPNDTGVDAIPSIPLEDGDELYVPSRPIVVSVFGDVYNQGSFLQRPGKTVSRYLREAGGPTRNADKNKVFVVLANGSVVSRDAAGSFWAGGFSSMVLMPGDAVIVPEQLNPGAAWRKFKDFAQILFDFGLAAAAVKVLSQ